MQSRFSSSRTKMLLMLPVIVAMLAGCAVGPNYQRPEASVPERYSGAAAQPAAALPDEALVRWWRTFGDATLDALEQKAAAANLDLQLAEARVRQARAGRGVAAGGLGPSAGASADYRRSRSSVSVPGSPNDRIGVVGNQYQAGFDAGWEIDIFGGRRRSLEAAEADLQGAIESQRFVMVSLAAEVARNYIQLRADQQQIAITRQNLEAQQRSAQITRERFEGGFVSGLDVANAEAQAATTAAQIPVLESAARQTMYSLSILLGEPPAALEELMASSPEIPVAPPLVPVGVPSDLLRRRPDIRQAEANIHAATARIGVAEAELFPKFNILGSVGVSAGTFSGVFDWANRFWSFGPSVTWRLFESGSLRAGVEVQKALQEQEFISYRQTVLGALQEVENALVASTKEQIHRQELERAVQSNQKAVALSRQLYTEGLTDFINVLQAQQALYASQIALAKSTASLSTDLVALYKSLGGGWSEQAHQM